MRTRDDYEKVTSIIREVIEAWDPYQLVASGAPAGEFDVEVTQLAVRSGTIRSEEDAARAVSDVFSHMFGEERFSPERCGEVGRQLYAALKTAHLIE